LSNSTITLQSIINLASTHADLLPLTNVGGYTDEPALSLCNDAIAEILTAPNDWKFNQVFPTMLVTTPNKQDYLYGGASAFTLGSTSAGAAIALASATGISESGTTVTVNTLEAHRFSVGDTVYMTGNTVAAYNSTFTDNGSSSVWSGGWVITAKTSTSFTFTHASSGLATSGAPGITDFGWLSEASMVEMNNTSSPQNIRQLRAVRDLPRWSQVGNPEKVCVSNDQGDGTLKIRFYFVPGSTIWGVNLVYQAKAPLKTALTQTWSPIPDNFSNVIRQALLARMYRYINSSNQTVEYQKLQKEIAKASGYDDAEQSNVYVTPEDGGLMNSGDGY
jgi:hypothetical protein